MIKVENLFDNLYDKDIYAGYLKTDIKGDELFCTFLPSQTGNRAENENPVILWLNGGPGCSSLFGFLGETGPVTTDLYSGLLTLNKYSWNTEADLIYIEQPAGVGFSKSSDDKRSFNDYETSKSLYEALKNFFEEFPEYLKKDFYITGESYAGVYIPFLAETILNDTNKSINLKGVLIGNGLTDFEVDIDRSFIEVAYWHSLISIETWNSFLKYCPHIEPESNAFPVRKVSKKCNEIRKNISLELSGLDVYGIYRMCRERDNLKINSNIISKKDVFLNTLNKIKNNYNKEEGEEEECSVWPYYGCDDDMTVYNFLNKETTKKKLGIYTGLNWTECNIGINLNYNASDSFSFYKNYIKNFPDLKVWVFSGDTDLAVPTLGTIRWINKLGLKIKEEYRQWHIGNQVAGYLQQYENLTFITIKGAGHMVPQDKREESKILLDSFIKGILPD